MEKVEDFVISYKQHQAWDTKRDFMLFYLPTLIPVDAISNKTHKLLSDCEKKFLMKLPHMWVPNLHVGPFPRCNCIIDWAKAGIFLENSEGAPEEVTSHCKVPTFVYDKSEYDQIMSIMREYKQLSKETR